jgi:hypothetical protein
MYDGAVFPDASTHGELASEVGSSLAAFYNNFGRENVYLPPDTLVAYQLSESLTEAISALEPFQPFARTGFTMKQLMALNPGVHFNPLCRDVPNACLGAAMARRKTSPGTTL